ncbi:MAG: TrmO family methyltransferase domain-containing protein [Promethearchaeia archaeon]
MPLCIQCKEEKEEDQIELIDGQYICHMCLYNNHSPYKIYPIGFVDNELARGERFGLKGSTRDISKIHLFSSQRPFLYKLDEEKWITLVFYFHQQRNIKSTFKRGMDGKRVGIFGSRTPERPSRIGVSNVKLVKIEKTTLYVKNFDAIDGTPILDIKLGENARW